MKKLKKCLLGAPKFKITTDHKPLDHLFSKSYGDIPPRIEKFIMDLQSYNYQLVYAPGETNIMITFHDTMLVTQVPVVTKK